MSPIPWFKVDDKLHDHRKARKARKAAMGVWVLAGSWCMDNLTDGFVPESVLVRWGNRRDASALVAANLWISTEKDGEKGWQFLNWTEFQPTKAEVESEREATKERVKKWREAKKRNAVTNDATNAPVTTEVQAPRPDPTRPDQLKTLPSVAEATPREDVNRLCNRLAEHIESNTGKRPSITKGWRDAARLLLDRDGRTEDQAAWLIDWCQRDEFWHTNVLSMPKFREKYDQLLLKARPATRGTATPFPVNGTEAEKDAWVKAQPLPADGAYYGGSAR